MPDCYFILRANPSVLRDSYAEVSRFVSAAKADLRNSRIYYDHGQFYVFVHYGSRAEALRQLAPLTRELMRKGQEIVESGVAENVRFKI